MRCLIIVLVLVSFGSISMGGFGDVYFCEEIQHIDFDKDGVIKEALDKLEFKITDKIIEIKLSSSRFINKKYFTEYMGTYNGNNFTSSYDISTKVCTKK